jgi:hypothetical protein
VLVLLSRAHGGYKKERVARLSLRLFSCLIRDDLKTVSRAWHEKTCLNVGSISPIHVCMEAAGTCPKSFAPTTRINHSASKFRNCATGRRAIPRKSSDSVR